MLLYSGMKKWLRRLTKLDTNKRFKKVIEKMEQKGVDLFIKGTPRTPSHDRAIRNYIKNLTTIAALYFKYLDKK